MKIVQIFDILVEKTSQVDLQLKVVFWGGMSEDKNAGAQYEIGWKKT